MMRDGRGRERVRHCTVRRARADKAVSAGRIDGIHDDRLQDAALADVVGKFVDLRLGELGARVVRVFVESIDADHQGAAITC
jgi:hypothetical protein